MKLVGGGRIADCWDCWVLGQFLLTASFVSRKRKRNQYRLLRRVLIKLTINLSERDARLTVDFDGCLKNSAAKYCGSDQQSEINNQQLPSAL